MAIRTARILGIPILVTEHVKKTMGNTSPELMKHLDEKKDHFVTKTYQWLLRLESSQCAFQGLKQS